MTRVSVFFTVLLLLCASASAQFFMPMHFSPPKVAPASCARGIAYNDLCPAAPAGGQTVFAPATVFSGYTARPPWNVAGVDYPIGFTTPLASLADWRTAPMPTGCVKSSNTITCSTNNVTISGFDFGLGGGATLVCNATSLTVQNNHFQVGVNHGALGTTFSTTTLCASLSFISNEVDGSNIAVTQQQGTTLNLDGTAGGTWLFKYNYMHNSGGDMIDFGQNGTSSAPLMPVFFANLFKDIGVNTAHSDTIQFYNQPVGSGARISFNYVWQTVNQPGAGNGLLVELSEGPSMTMASLDVSNNGAASLAACTACNWAFGFYVDLGATAQNISVRNNYVDPTGVNLFTGSPWFATAGGPGIAVPSGSTLGNPSAYHDLTNMVSGASIPVPSATSKTASGYWLYPDQSGYTPSLTDIFSISATPATGNLIAGQTATFALNMAVIPWSVTGAPTLSLNNGGTAIYTSGSGTSTLNFTYTVGAADTTADIAITAVNLAGGAIKDANGNAANLTAPRPTFAGLTANKGVGISLAGGVPSTGNTSSSVAFNFTYSVAAPSGMTCVWNPGAVAGGAVTGFTAAAGSGSGSCPTPIAANTYTMQVTGTGANIASAAAPNTTVITQAGPVCPDSDGSAGASAGTPQYPNMLAGYGATINGTHGLGCKVAGVDYHVGLPAGTVLVTPTAGNLPTGATLTEPIVHITANNVTFQGFDMTSRGVQIDDGVTGTVIQNNKFQATANCVIPISMTNAAGVTTIQYNTIDGGGTVCGTDGTGTSWILPTSWTGDVSSGGSYAGASIIYQYNWEKNIQQDGEAFAGSPDGTAGSTFTLRYNLYDGAAWVGHPDGIQTCGGVFASPVVTHNTFYVNPALISGTGYSPTQPFHIEAQCTPGNKITNARVTFNTMAMPTNDPVNGCRYPATTPIGCSASSSLISCKFDNGLGNIGFQAYGNYMDWSGGTSSIDVPTACTSTVWGAPYDNWDMVAATAIARYSN